MKLDLQIHSIQLKIKIIANKIIYVDSGSTDGSLEFAIKNNFKIIKYTSNSFNYSKSQILG